MTYCEYIEQLFYRATDLTQRLIAFHFAFGKQYVKQLYDELKDVQNTKKN